MKKAMLYPLLTLLTFTPLVTVAQTAEPAKTPVKMPELPPEVKKTIRQQVGKGRIADIEKTTEDGQVVYEVEIRKANQERSFAVSQQGELLDREVFLGETPEAVRATIEKHLGTGELEGITEVFEDGEVTYETEMTKDGKARTFTVDASGKLTEFRVFLAELPLPAQKTALQRLGSGKLGDITEVFEDGAMTYDVEINPDIKPVTVTIDTAGKVVYESEAMTLTNAPEAIQNAVKDLVKDGKLHTLSKITESDEVTYDVEIKRGGKWETTSIGTDGKIIP